MVLGDGVHQGVHHGVEDDHREWVTLVDTFQERDGGGCPLAGGEDTQEAAVEVRHHVDHHWRGVVVGQ